MNSKLFKILSLIALTTGMVACGDDNSNSKDPSTDNTPRCEGNISVVGDQKTNCADKGGCDAATGLCKNTTPSTSDAVCDGATSVKDGLRTDCGAKGCNAATGLCNTETPSTGKDCEGSAKKCEGNAAYICMSGAWSKAEDCAEGCEGDVCKFVPKDPCAGIRCTAGTCDRGVCVNDTMKNLKEDDECDVAEFAEFCNGETAVYCDQGYVAFDECADKCITIKDEYGLTAYCDEGSADKCKTEEDTFEGCNEITEQGTSVSFNVEYLCLHDTTGKMITIVNDYVQCGGACNADHTACKVLDPNEGKACNASTADACKGDVLVYCDTENSDNDNGSTVAVDCAYAGGVCGSVDGELNCYETCTDTTKTNSVCIDDDTTAMLLQISYGMAGYTATYQCQKTDDNKNSVWVADEDVEYCDHACTEKRDACLMIDANEGKACDATYVESCTDKNVILYCKGDTVAAVACNETMPCSLVEGIANCYEPCTEEGATRCDAESGVPSTCKKNDADVLVWFDGDECIDGCATDGKTCKAITWTSDAACSAVKLSDKKTTVAEYCGVKTGVCANGTPYGCFDACTTLEDTKTECVTDDKESSTITYTCTQFGDKNFWEAQSAKACDNGCNTNKTDCAEMPAV